MNKFGRFATLFIFAVFYTSLSHAQYDEKLGYGVKFGANTASFQNDNNNSDSRVGIVAGAFLSYELTNIISTDLEILYSMKGVKSNESKVKIDYIEFPLLIKASYPLSSLIEPVFYVGGAFGYKVKAKLENNSTSTDYGSLVNKTDYSWVVGGGSDIRLGKRIIILDIRYTSGLKSFFNFGDPSDSDSDDKHQVVSFTMGYEFQ